MTIAALEPLFNLRSTFEVDDDEESGEAGTLESSEIQSSTGEQLHAVFTRPVSQLTLNELVTAIVASFTIVLSLVAMIIEGSIYAVISGIFSIIMGTFAHYQQTQLRTLATMKATSIKLEKDVVRLKGDNTRLTYDVDELDGRVEDLLDVEDALKVISLGGQSVDALQIDADINLDVVCTMHKSVQVGVIETLVSSIFCREGDGETDIDTPITEEDTSKMIKKFQSIAGLSVDEGRLRDTVEGNSIESIIDALQNLLDEDIPARSRIFHVK